MPLSTSFFASCQEIFTETPFPIERSVPREGRKRGRRGLRMGCAVFLICVVAAIASPAQTFTTLAIFDGSNGARPRSTLVQGLDGNFYGTTQAGGPAHGPCGSLGCGTVFELSPSGVVSKLHTFCRQRECADGWGPLAGLALIRTGEFYGTTSIGGLLTGTCQGSGGCGTVFTITPGGKLTTTHSFDLSDGSSSVTPLVQAANGNFYGTTFVGGANGLGTIFQVTSGGNLTTVYSFCAQTNCADGQNPVALVQGTDGNLYGTAVSGGAHPSTCFQLGCGTLFKVPPQGTLATIYSFCAQTDCTDGSQPGPLVQGTDGNFYGVTTAGGGNSCPLSRFSCGTIFKVTPQGALTTLYRFCAQTNCTDGSEPAGLVQGTDGNFYGVTTAGGAVGCFVYGCGTIFKITPGGMLTTLYTFCTQSNCPDGWSPLGGLLQATDGSFYGTTYVGGGCGDADETGCGTVFDLSMGLGPFVKTLPAFGNVGAHVKILGTNLTGATAVTFRGIAATFTVVSSSEITTTVPTGATTGEVRVTTPSGTLASNVVFRVRP